MQFSGPPQTIESKQLASGGTLALPEVRSRLMPEEVREVRVGYGCAGAAGGVWLRWCCAGAALVLRWCCAGAAHVAQIPAGCFAGAGFAAGAFMEHR